MKTFKFVLIITFFLIIIIGIIFLYLKIISIQKNHYIEEKEKFIKSEFFEKRKIYDNLINAIKNFDIPQKDELYDDLTYVFTEKDNVLFLRYKNYELLIEDNALTEAYNQFINVLDNTTQSIIIIKNPKITGLKGEIISFMFAIENSKDYLELKLFYCETPIERDYTERLADNWYFERVFGV